MSRILICANTLSGKTTFMYGTFHQMMKGIYGFTLAPKYHFAQFNRQCKRIGDTRLPLNERFPAPSDRIEAYTFVLKYNLKTIDEIQWIDYPGNLLEEDEDNPDNVRLMEYLSGTDCLFLCVDGSHFNHETKAGILNAIHCDGGGMELNFLLNRAAADRQTGEDRPLPPVCVIITKYDLVEPDKRREDFLVDILKEEFPILFYPAPQGQTRLVSVCPVTLGRDISRGGKLEPRNIEKPFCYLTFLRQAAALRQRRQELEQMEEAARRYQKREESHKRYHRIWQLLTPRSDRPAAEEDIRRMAADYRCLEEDLRRMKGSLQNMALFCNGEQIPWDSLIENGLLMPEKNGQPERGAEKG